MYYNCRCGQYLKSVSIGNYADWNKAVYFTGRLLRNFILRNLRVKYAKDMFICLTVDTCVEANGENAYKIHVNFA